MVIWWSLPCHFSLHCAPNPHTLSLVKMQKHVIQLTFHTSVTEVLEVFAGLLPSCPVTEIVDFSLCVMQWSWHVQLPWFGVSVVCVQQLIVLHPIANRAEACTPARSVLIMVVQCKGMTCKLAIISVASLCSILHKKRIVLEKKSKRTIIAISCSYVFSDRRNCA